MSSGRNASSVQSVQSPSLTPTPNQSSFFATNVAYKLFSSPSVKPDPDQEGIVWHEPETYSAVISRKEHPRDHASLLSLREVLRNRASVEGFNGLSSRFGGAEGSKSSKVSGMMPPSAWANPTVESTHPTIRGEISGLPDTESAGKLLQEMETASTESSHVGSLSSNEMSKSQFGDVHIHRGNAPSLISDKSELTVGPKDGDMSQPPALPPKDSEPPPPETSSFFTNSLTNAVRYMLNTGDLSRPTKNQSSLLPRDSLRIDDRPHIKYDWMIGKRLKFSCTVYYAKEFDGLRRRCGIEDIFLKSLGRIANWAAEGGKSKSNFWKTNDDRFIIKTLVNAWNVADL
jgi:1-phosphatidylinositol-3-phosphate 5-kinase